MRSRRSLAGLVGAGLLVLVPVAAQGANERANYHAVCPGPPAKSARCHAEVVVDAHGKPVVDATPSGVAPADIRRAYGFSGDPSAGAGKTIAIVDAYDDPSAESDLATFSSQFGLPACTTANGCFAKVNQSGGTGYPRADSGWGLEISLDVQWAHAVAPGAKILLVEASSNSFADLLSAESYASGHATYVSNSWGAGEFSSEAAYDGYFSRAGVSFFASAGDAGLPAEYPSASPNVISVGGTTLHFDGSGNLTDETGWAGGGGGCSAYETATTAQSSFAGYAQANCGGRRATPDVSLDADPASGVSVYDSYGYGGWLVVGGTSASSPMWAARSADAATVVNAAYVYGSGIPYRDITSGNNGAPCLSGFDLCSGRGSWNDGGGTQPAPDFSISASPSSRSVTAGQGTTYDVTVTGINGFSGAVSFGLSGQPAGVSGTFTSSTLTSSTAAGTTAGTYQLTITGTSGTLSHSTTVSLVVSAAQQADFSIGLSPSSRSVKRGRSTTYAIAVTRTGGFTGPVAFGYSGPAGTSVSFSPASTSGSSATLTVRTTSSTPRGTWTVTVTGSGNGGAQRAATASLTVR